MLRCCIVEKSDHYPVNSTEILHSRWCWWCALQHVGHMVICDANDYSRFHTAVCQNVAQRRAVHRRFNRFPLRRIQNYWLNIFYVAGLVVLQASSRKQAAQADGAAAVQWPWTKVLAFLAPTDYSTPHSEKSCPRSHLAPPSLRRCLAEGSLLATFRNQRRGCLTERARRHGASARKNRCGGYGNRRN